MDLIISLLLVVEWSGLLIFLTPKTYFESELPLDIQYFSTVLEVCFVYSFSVEALICARFWKSKHKVSSSIWDSNINTDTEIIKKLIQKMPHIEKVGFLKK